MNGTPTGRRTPHGVRGLKSLGGVQRGRGGVSHPSRGAWIEIRRASPDVESESRRTPHGVRGLKLPMNPQNEALARVAPLTGCVD